MLGFIGIEDVEFIMAEGVAIAPEQRQAVLDDALAQIGRIEPLALAA